jgi:hypothetical protein
MSVAFLALQCLDGFANTGDNRRGLIPQLITDAGFEGLHVLRRLRTVAGTFEVMAADAPEAGPVGGTPRGNLGA